jgi:ATP-dependent protease ClpP protease subunit
VKAQLRGSESELGRDLMALQLRITGVITEVSAATFLSDLNKAGGKPVDVLFNTEGGDVQAGLRMYDAILEYPGHVRCVVESLAASMGSIVMLAGDEVLIYKGAEVMIHPPEAVFPPEARGTADNLEAAAAMLRKTEARLLDIYSGKMGLDPEKVKAVWGVEPYINAENAIRLGLVDKVIDGAPDFASVAQINLSTLRALKSSDRIVRMVAKAKGKKNMSEKQLKALRALLGLAATATADECLAALDKAEETAEEEAPAEEEEEEEEEEEASADDAAAEDAVVAEALSKLPAKAQLAVLKRMAAGGTATEDRAALLAKLPDTLRAVASQLSGQVLRAFVESNARPAAARPRKRTSETQASKSSNLEERAQRLVKAMGGTVAEHMARLQKAEAAKKGASK